MKPRKQRLHSAELRRLDHIARSLDRIADALQHLPDVIVSGNNDTVIYGNDDMAMRDMDIKAGEKTQISLHTINNAYGIDGENLQGVLINGSDNSVVGSGNNQNGDGNVFAKQSPAAGSKIDSSQVSTSGDSGASATGGASATIDNHSDIDRIDVGQGVGVQEASRTDIRNPKLDSGNTSQTVEGDNVATSGSDAVGKVVGDVDYYTNHAERGIAAKTIATADQRTEIKGISKAFNTNANDVVKDLTGALLTKLHQKSDNNPKGE